MCYIADRTVLSALLRFPSFPGLDATVVVSPAALRRFWSTRSGMSCFFGGRESLRDRWSLAFDIDERTVPIGLKFRGGLG